MSSRPAIRPYDSADREACLAVFDSNVSDYVAPGERALFAGFLDERPGPFFVVSDPARTVVACGGYALQASGRSADFCWGMVTKSAHGQGLGRLLARQRIADIRRNPQVDRIRLDTSQHTVGFYEHLGFRTVRIDPAGYGPGLDRCEMELLFRQTPVEID